jgi:glycosyltransferase involved in cell wall biosynthesis
MTALNPIKLCIIGKYPPIEGGVSRWVYWFARSAASMGHQVHVVTNAEEVEPEFRMFLSEADRAMLECDFDNGGFVRHYSTRDTHSTWHIPNANPYGTKLAAIATDVVREHGCSFVHTSYLEPYAFAGALVSQWTEVPYAVQHAGSDLGRLAQERSYRSAYLAVMANASLVVSGSPVARRLIAAGVPADRMWLEPHRYLPSKFFQPNGALLDVGALAEEMTQSGAELPFRPPQPFRSEWPCIGIYGKPGPRKGTAQLIRALGRLRRRGMEFNLIALCGLAGAQSQRMQSQIHAEELGDRSYMFPFVPHWIVPQFLRRCMAVAFLEHDFPIGIHTPTIPLEVQACGTCLVVSGEIARSQWPPVSFRDGRTCLVVDDPTDVDALVEVLAGAIRDPARTKAIGQAGCQARYVPNDEKVFEPLLHRFAEIAHEDQLSRRAAILLQRTLARGESSSMPVYALDEELTDVAARLSSARFHRLWQAFRRVRDRFPDAAVEFKSAFQAADDHQPRGFADEIQWFRQFLEGEATEVFPSAPDLFLNLVRLDAVMLVAALRPLPTETFDSLNDPVEHVVPEKPSLRSRLRLQISPGATIERFEYDVNSLLQAETGQEPERRPCAVAIVTEPDVSQPRVLTLGPALQVLVGAVSVPIRVSELVEQLVGSIQAAPEGFETLIVNGLAQLINAGIITAHDD